LNCKKHILNYTVYISLCQCKFNN